MSYKCFLVLSFLCVLEVLLADQKLCNKLKPCGDRGTCGRSSDQASDLLTIKCVCRDKYTGRWCQFVDNKYQPGPKDKVPGKPKILTDTSVPNYYQNYFLKFMGVKDPPRGKVLYYLVRYTDVTTPQREWRSVAVKNKGGVHKLFLDKLDWGHKYKLELYAGNTHGLGEPDQRTLKRPQGTKLAKKNSCSNALIFASVGGIGGSLLLGILFCVYRSWYLRSQNEDYMPLTRVKTQSVELKSVLGNKRESTALNGSQLPSTKRSSVTSDTSDVPSLKCGSLPPPTPPLPARSTSQWPSQKERRLEGKTRQSSSDFKKESSNVDTVGLDKTALKRGKAGLQSGKAKDMPVHKTSKDSGSRNVPNNPFMSPFTPKGRTSSDDSTLKEAVLESGNVRDANVHKMLSPTVTKGSPNDDKIDLPNVGKARDSDGENVVKQDSNSLFVPKRPSEPPAVPSEPSGSDDIYGGLIGFENAILETGDDQINVRKAMIQKIK